MLKNLGVYYWFIAIPFILIISMFTLDINKSYGILLLLAYVSIYRPFIDGLRLYQIGTIERKDFWKISIPFYSSKYFNTLYFKG